MRLVLQLFIIALLIFFAGCTIRDDLLNIIEDDDCEDIISYTDWSICDSTATQTRYQLIIYCNESTAQIAEHRNCIPACAPNWVCDDWGECRKDGFRRRACTDTNFCNLVIDVPPLVQRCDFINPCSSISREERKALCNSIIFENVSHCLKSLSSVSDVEVCIFRHAEFFMDVEACNLINDSYNRNTCKARAGLSRDYCDILAPEYRNECYPLVDYRYLELASIYLDSSYCNYIESESIKSNCKSGSNYNYYSTYKESISSCNSLSYDSNVALLYQTVRACYVYHISQLRDDSICGTLPGFIRNDCYNIINYNLSYCYDLSGDRRDWCLANMMYYYDNPLLCREASDEDNCYYTIGHWFKEIDYCSLIKDKTKREFCTSSYINYCNANFYNCYPENYCSLIFNDTVAKDTCIFNRIINEIIKEGKEW